MPTGAGGTYDYFLSRRGSVAAVAREVTDVLNAKGYSVFVQDYDIALGASFVEAMHEAVQAARDLIILFTRDYETSTYTRKEFTSFEAQRLQDPLARRIVVLRCEDAPLAGLLADNVYQDLVGIDDPEERKRRIVAAVEGHSQALKPTPRPFVGVPPRVAGFTGRAEELDRLDAILMQEKPAAVTQAVGRAAVQGLGGVGKTSLAAEYAHRFRGLYAGVWWCPAEDRTGLLTSLASLGAMLAGASAEEADVENAAKSALRALAERRATWLLVYDNVTSPEEIADLLPPGGARLLITSRFSDWGGWAEEVALDVLPLEEATAFLQSRAGFNDEAGATLLAETLGRLPLALDHAAAFCRSAHMRFADYAAKASQLIAAAPPRARRAAYPRSVAATFDLAIDAAVAQCPAAEALMAFFAQCAPERIPMVLVEGAIEDETERLEALAALTELSLVKHDPFEDGTSAATVHRLVQAVGRGRAEGKGMAQGATERFVARLAAICPGDGYDNPKSWATCAQLTAHVLSQRAGGVSKELESAKWAAILSRMGSYLNGRGTYGQAALLFRESFAIREKVVGPEHPDTAQILNNLALLLIYRGEFAEARPLFDRALAIYEKTRGSEHPETASVLNNLGLLLHEQGEFVAARPVLERALAISEKLLGPEHADTAGSLSQLAKLLVAQGDLAGARPLIERAVAIQEKALGSDHPSTAHSLSVLANLTKNQGNLAGASTLYQRALVIYEKALGSQHPHTVTTLNNLAFLLQEQGDDMGARPLYERALEINEKTLGPEHPDTAVILNNLGRLLRDTGHAAEAEPLFGRAIAIGEKALGRDHSRTQRYASHYARLLLQTGRAAEALPMAQFALATHGAASGPNHPWTKDSARVTADALDALDRREEAKALRERYGLGGDSA
jgi:tetratricopeptide (TPR) repeat protein